MGDTLKKVQPGDPLRIPAATFNTLIDVARAHLERKQNVGGQSQAASPPPGVILTIRNDSGSDRDRFEVLGLDEPVFPPEDNTADMSRGPVMSGVYPVDPDHLGAFVVLLEPIASGAVGRAMIQGAVPVQVDFADTAPNTWADISDGVAANLKAMATGSARILWRTGEPGDTGVEWCICELTGSSDRRVAVTSEDSTPAALRSTDEEVEDKPHKVVGDDEEQIDETPADGGWIACEVLGEAEANQQLVIGHKHRRQAVDTSNFGDPFCGIHNLRIDAGHIVAFQKYNAQWNLVWVDAFTGEEIEE
jgi:hypothetical protein